MAQTLENVQVETRWTPVSAEDRELVRRELEAIVSSYHFKGSKRYPALLKYVVDASLENRAHDLKERTLGVEVFGRDPDYDTNADPVVRVSAGEVRKRIAQFYHENGHASRLQIELPIGSYAPEFLLRAPDSLTAPAQLAGGTRPLPRSGAARHGWSRLWPVILALMAALAAATFMGKRFWRPAPQPKIQSIDQFWNPMLQSTRPVIIVLGTTHPTKMRPESAQTTLGDSLERPYHHVSVSIALALANLAGVLKEHGKGYEVKESMQTSLTDIRSRSVILVGGLNNDWTMRLTHSLRFHFFAAPDGLNRIEDTANPRQSEWKLDYSTPYSTINADYAIVARFRDPTVQGPVMVMAGVGPFGTEAAGEFVQSPQYLDQLARLLPGDWEDKNLEVVLKTNVIGGQAGPPVLVSTYTW